MKKLKDFDRNYLFIIIICLVALYIVVPENHIFGSTIDWASQHVVFPDYFRKLFYHTGNLFPNFALSLGAGQNIYNFSYYGLLNPIILISYLLPFVSMKTYIIIANSILYILFGLFLYKFLKHRYSTRISFISAIILLFSAPVLFHFHKHFMFVDYLPFLALALIGVDKYFEKNKKSLLAFSVFLIIMISYYYSVFSIGIICIYGLFRYLELNDKFDFKDMVKTGCKFLVPIIIGVMMSGVLLLPTFYVLKTGRAVNNSTITLLEMLLPRFNIDSVLYNNYSLGLTSIALLSIFYLLVSNKKENKYLSIIFLIIVTIPIFIYLLNGKLYFRNKVLIPFLPLFGVIISKFLTDLFSNKIDILKVLIITIIVVVTSLFCSYFNVVFYLDILITTLMIYIYYKGYTNQIMFSIVIIMFQFGVMYYSNINDIYLPSVSNSNNIDIDKEIKNVLNKEPDMVRFNNLDDTLSNVNEVYIANYNQDSLYSSVSNQLYKDFYKKTFKNALSYRNKLVMSQNNDVLFQMFMGVKYIYSLENAPVGYEKIDKNIYRNNNVLPMFYGTSELTNEKIFDGLSYPYNIGTLLNSTVVSGKSTKDVTNQIKKIDLDYNIDNTKNVNISKNDNYIKIESKNKGRVVLSLNKQLKNDILIISFKLKDTPDCSVGDAMININGISNVLTCKQWMYKNRNKVFNYVISSNDDVDKLNIDFSKGTYKIENLNFYELEYNDLKDIKNNLSRFVINKNKTIGDNIIGNIDMKNDGYFTTSIPYDKGFKVYVDDKRQSIERVNKAFLGFKLKEGFHKIKIVYESPLFSKGIILSILGFISFFVIIIYDILNKKKK